MRASAVGIVALRRQGLSTDGEGSYYDARRLLVEAILGPGSPAGTTGIYAAACGQKCGQMWTSAAHSA